MKWYDYIESARQIQCLFSRTTVNNNSITRVLPADSNRIGISLAYGDISATAISTGNKYIGVMRDGALMPLMFFTTAIFVPYLSVEQYGQSIMEEIYIFQIDGAARQFVVGSYRLIRPLE